MGYGIALLQMSKSKFKTMRKVFLLGLLLPLLIACNQEIEEENQRLNTENEELMLENQEKDSLINDFVTSFTRIQENLATIREKEERIQAAKDGNLETSLDQREEIIMDIEAINELLSENRQSIAALEDKLKRYNYENAKFKRMVSDLSKQVEVKDSQVVVLKENLATMNFEMEALNNKYVMSEEQRMMQQEMLKAKEDQLNSAYYAVGTSQELNENNVVDKKGGFIGIGKTKALAEDFNRDYFTKINISKTTSIPMNLENDDAKIVSNHPTESWKWVIEDKKIKSLEISDPEKFWSGTKYLVVLVD